jgi:cbb3-type cytochrome oxidase subunit 3
LGYNSPSFKNSPFWDKLLPGFLYSIVTIPFTSFPLLILSIVLRKKNKKLYQSGDVKTEEDKKIIELNRKIYSLGFITFIATFLPSFFVLLFFVIGLYAASTVM